MSTHDVQPDLDPYAVELGANVHAAMWRRKVTQAQLGAMLGLSQSLMSKKIRGQVPTTVTDLMRIAGALGVDAGDLLPRLDSNQEPSGYLSSQVSDRDALVYSLDERRQRTLEALPGQPVDQLRVRLAAASAAR